ADLDGNVAGYHVDDGFDGGGILRFAGHCAVEVHQVQTTCTLIEPLLGHGGGVLGEYGCVVKVALAQANTAPVLEVDGGDQEHDESADKMRENGFRRPPPHWLRWRADRERYEGSGLPFYEVAIELEAMFGAFLGVELYGKNVICCDGAGKALPVLTNPY